jgi:hypothetical protein
VAETTVKRFLSCGFRRNSKAMGQACQCWWRICQEINVLTRFEYHMFYVLYPFVSYLLTLPRRFSMSIIQTKLKLDILLSGIRLSNTHFQLINMNKLHWLLRSVKYFLSSIKVRTNVTKSEVPNKSMHKSVNSVFVSYCIQVRSSCSVKAEVCNRMLPCLRELSAMSASLLTPWKNRIA